MVARPYQLQHAQDWRSCVLVLCAMLLGALADWHLSRWLLEGAKPAMYLAWTICGVPIVWMACTLLLVHLFGLMWRHYTPPESTRQTMQP